MFADFRRSLTRFRGQLFLRGGRNLSLLASEEDWGGVELASQQRLTRLAFSRRTKTAKGHAHILLQCCTAVLLTEETEGHEETAERNNKPGSGRVDPY